LGDYTLEVSPGDGERRTDDHAYRMLRGGGGESTAVYSRSAWRGRNAPEVYSPWLGLRPSRRIETR
jgi:formylglycine-generating enzyme required for sulfatase activity